MQLRVDEYYWPQIPLKWLGIKPVMLTNLLIKLSHGNNDPE